jgi:hypothetical protein
MSEQIENKVDLLGRAWEEYKATNDQRLEEVKKLGAESAETKAKLA